MVKDAYRRLAMSRSCPHHPDPTKPRREFLLRSAACGAALLLPATTHAGKLHELDGEVMVNGRLASKANEIRALDVIRTGPGGRVVLTMGKDAFLIRAGSEVEILGKPKAILLTGLRMLTGALLGVFGKGGPRQLLTATATAGIRGTGIYIEASPARTYFCTCYGTVEIEDQHRTEKRLVVSGYHSPNIIYAEMTDGRMMQKAEFINHTDDELVMLEKLVGRKPPFVRP
jgi:hypothetical protein